MPERVLLLGDDLRAFLAIARSLGRRGIEVHAAPSDFSSSALKSRYIAASHRLPPHPLDPQAWEKALAKLIAEQGFGKVLPTSDSGLFMLRHHSEGLGRARLGIGNEEALEIFTDKAKTRALAERHGVAVARGLILDSGHDSGTVAAELGLPLVLKPRASYAIGDVASKRSAMIVRDKGELEARLGSGAWNGCVAESYFPGIGVGVSVLALEGRILFAYQHKRLRESSETGASTRRVSEPVDPALFAAVEPLAAAVRLDGVAMFEFRVDRRSGRHILLEVNPRFWGSLPLAVAAGADFPALWWDLEVHGRETAGTYRTGVVRADLTGEFDRIADGAESGGLRGALTGLLSAIALLAARRRADSWSSDDPAPWREERRVLAGRLVGALRKRLPGRTRRHRIRFEDFARRSAERAKGRTLRLLVVGRDNVRRSAFGERLLGLRLAGLPVTIASAGYMPRRGDPASPAAVAEARKFGIDLSRHRSSTLTPEQIETADALVLLDADAEWRLRQMCPQFTAETVALAGPDSFPSIAAGLERLANVVRQGLEAVPQPPSLADTPPAAQRAA